MASESSYSEDLRRHYVHRWGKPEVLRFQAGPIHELPENFRVLAFAPRPSRALWTFATEGMSQPGDEEGLELHIFSQARHEELVEILVAVAHYHRTGARLGLGHTVNFGRPWVAHSRCEYGLVSLPYLDGPELELFKTATGTARLLWLVPITRDEVAYARKHGMEALESLFERTNFDYADPNRPDVTRGFPE